MAARALLLTDVVDSTRLVETLGDVRASEVWAAHDTAARELLPAHDGREIDKTDGFLLLFDAAADAAAYAIAYHRVLRDLSARLGVPLSARAGLHVGEVVLRETPAAEVARGAKPLDVEGIAKPIAARVMSLAGAGQTLVSGPALAAIGDLAPGLSVRVHGHYRLKGVAEPMEIAEVGADEDAPFTPPPDAAKVYRVVRDGDLWMPARDVPHNLPRERDVFVGRVADLAAVADRFDDGAVLVTLSGPGGTGKTRLSTRFAWTWLGDFPGGAWFCDLAETRTLEGIAGTVAQALGLAPPTGDPVVAIGRALHARGPCLVVLDNFEQIVDFARDSLGRWLDLAPDARFLVTSRELLQLSGEHVVALEPLPVPEPEQARDDDPAMALFLARARQVHPQFALTPESRADLARLLAMLDGIPLAIELAAARARVMSPSKMLERISRRFELLSGSRRTHVERQTTLRAAIDWSWDLLQPWERAAFAQCSVFEGGFDLEAAEDVIDLEQWPEAPMAMDVVQGLVDKSLLRAWTPSLRKDGQRVDFDEPFFGMYVSLKEYAGERLEQPGAIGGTPPASGPEVRDATERRHAAHFARRSDEVRATTNPYVEGLGSDQRPLLERDNVVAALRRALGWGDADLAAPLFELAGRILIHAGSTRLAATLGAALVALPGLSDEQAAAARTQTALMLWKSGQFDEASALFRDTAAWLADRDMPNRLGTVYNGLAAVAKERGQYDQAMTWFEEARRAYAASGSTRAQVMIDANIGSLLAERGLAEQAMAHYRELLTRSDLPPEVLFDVRNNLGSLAAMTGRRDEAIAQRDIVLALARQTSATKHLLAALQLHAHVLQVSEGPAAAVVALEEMLEVATRAEQPRMAMMARDNLAKNLRALGRHDEALRHAEAGLSVARRLRDRRMEVSALTDLAQLHAAAGRASQAIALEDEAVAVAEAGGDPFTIATAANGIAIRRAIRGDIAGARPLFERSLALWEDLGRPDKVAMVAGNLGNVHRLLRDREAAIASYERAIAVERTGIGSRPWNALSNLATLVAPDEPERAIALAGEAEAAVVRAGNPYERNDIFHRLAQVRAWTGDLAGARAALSAAAAITGLHVDEDAQASHDARYAVVELLEGDATSARARMEQLQLQVSEGRVQRDFGLDELMTWLETRLP